MEEQHNSDSLISSSENEIEIDITIHNCRIFGHHHLTDTIRPTLGSQYLAAFFSMGDLQDPKMEVR